MSEMTVQKIKTIKDELVEIWGEKKREFGLWAISPESSCKFKIPKNLIQLQLQILNTLKSQSKP